MKAITTPSKMSRNQATRPYELVATLAGKTECRHYWSYDDALCDYAEQVVGDAESVSLRRLAACGADSQLGVSTPGVELVEPPVTDDGLLFVKTVIACTDAMGTPSFTFSVVRCSKEQYAEGDHYAAAEQQAEEDGYEGSMVAYDENDGPEWLFERFQWDEIDTPVNILENGPVN